MAEAARLEIIITADNADEVISKLRGIGATARGEASEGVSAFERQFSGVVDRMLERLGVLELAFKTIEMFKVAAEAEEANARLASSFSMLGSSLDQFQDKIESAMRPLEAWGFYTRSEMNNALSQLVALTGDANKSIESLDVVVELAHYRHLDLGTAALYVTKAMEGEVGMLGRYIPGLKDADDKMQFLRDHLKVFAESDAKTTAGAFRQVATEVKELAEKFGMAVYQTGEWDKALKGVLDTLKSLESPIRALGSALGFTTHNIATGIAVLKTALTMGDQGGPMDYAREFQRRVTGTELTSGTLGVSPAPTDTGIPAILGGARAQLAQSGNSLEGSVKEIGSPAWWKERARLTAEAIKKAQQEYQQHLRALMETILDNIGNRSDKVLGRLAPTGGPLIDVLFPALSPTRNTYTNAEGDQSFANVSDRVEKSVQAVAKAVEAQKQKIQDASIDVGSAIFDGIVTGMTRKKGGLAAGFTQMTAEVLKGLGDMIMRMAGPVAIFGKLMLALQAAISANPIFAGAVAIVVAAALTALASSLSASASGSSGAGGNFAIASSGQGVNMTQYLTPTPGAPFAAGHQYPGGVMQPIFNIFGPNDPQAQRSLAQAMQNVARRNFKTS